MANAASKLEPYRQFIAKERKRRTTYRQLAVLLAEKGITVDPSTIYSFVKVRSKPPRRVVTMWEGIAENTSPAGVSMQQASAGTQRIPKSASAQTEAIQRLKEAKPTAAKKQKGLATFKPDAPLDRLSDKQINRGKDRFHH